MAKSSIVRALLADDSREFLAAFGQVLAGYDSLVVVGWAVSGRDALEQAGRLRPDLVFMDITMPEMDGLEATRQLKRQPDPPFVAVVTLHDLPEYRAAALAAGADAFVTMQHLGRQLPEVFDGAMHRVAPGASSRAG